MENNELDINKIFNLNNELESEMNILNNEINAQYDVLIETEKKEKKDNIYLTESLTGVKEVHLDKEFEQDLYDCLIQLDMLNESIAEKKNEIKKFIEDNNLGSFKTELLNVTYTSATTTTSIDSTRLKKELPDIAAKYSKVGAKSSSVAIKTINNK